MDKNIGPIPNKFKINFKDHYSDKSIMSKQLDKNLCKKDRYN